jgi:hypothetical protein
MLNNKVTQVNDHHPICVTEVDDHSNQHKAAKNLKQLKQQ